MITLLHFVTTFFLVLACILQLAIIRDPKISNARVTSFRYLMLIGFLMLAARFIFRAWNDWFVPPIPLPSVYAVLFISVGYCGMQLDRLNFPWTRVGDPDPEASRPTPLDAMPSR